MHRDVLHPYSPHDHQHETIGYHQSEISKMQCSDPCQDTSPCEPSCRLVCIYVALVVPQTSKVVCYGSSNTWLHFFWFDYNIIPVSVLLEYQS